MSPVPILTDGVVTLRGLREDDVDAVREQCSDPEMQRWTTVPVPYSRDDATFFVRHAVPTDWELDRAWTFALEAEGRFGGTVALRGEGPGRAEVSFGASAWARGTGYVERAVRLLLAWGFEQRDLQTVSWLAHRGNWASRRLAWRLGFAFHGTWPSWLEQRGTLHDAWTGTLRRGDELSPRSPWLETPTIHGDGLVLRALAERDLPRIVETLNDPETQRWHERPRIQAPHTLENQADFVLARHEQAASGTGLHWAVADADSDAYLGQMTLFSVQHRRQASLSYWTHPDARGRGVTSQAARLVVRHCFVPWEDGGLGLRRLWSDAEPGNGASRRVLEKAGFVQTGVDRASEPAADGGWADQVRYDLLAEDLTG